MATTVDVKAFIDERPISAFQWFLVAMCFVLVAADGMDVAIMGFVTPSILQEWDISRPAFGLVISAAPFGLVLGALVAGPSSDRLGRKIVLVVSVFLFGIFTICAAFASSPSRWRSCVSLQASEWARQCPTLLRFCRNTRRNEDAR